MNIQKVSVSVKNEELNIKATYSVMSFKGSIIQLILFLVLFVFCFVVFVMPTDEKRFENRPEQVEQAEVAGKRREGRATTRSSPTYVVSFRLTDGSEKEFVTGHSGSNTYDAVQEGVTGTLTYKEIESDDGARTFKSHRRFISFEKDPEYGGEVLEIKYTETLDFITMFFFLGPWLITFIILSVISTRDQAKLHRIPLQEAIVKVTRKYKKSKDKSSTEYFVTFSFPGGMKKPVLVGRNNSEAYDFVNKGDTGTLIYQTYYNEIISCSFKKDPVT